MSNILFSELASELEKQELEVCKYQVTDSLD